MKAALATVGVVLLAVGAAFAGDAEIKQRIEARLAKAGLDKRTDIAVSVESGVARLTASRCATPTCARPIAPPARTRARGQRAARRPRVPAIRQGDPHRRPGARCCGWERYGAFDAVAIDVKDGVVSLRGWVDNPYKKEEIENTPGPASTAIRDVHNDLRVQGFSSGDRELLREIFLRIYRDPMFERWASTSRPAGARVRREGAGDPRRHRRQRGREAGRREHRARHAGLQRQQPGRRSRASGRPRTARRTTRARPSPSVPTSRAPGRHEDDGPRREYARARPCRPRAASRGSRATS